MFQLLCGTPKKFLDKSVIKKYIVFLCVASMFGCGLVFFAKEYQTTLHHIAQSNLTWNTITQEKLKKQNRKQISLLFVGDIMLSRAVERRYIKYDDVRFPFLRVAESMRQFDVVSGNLEGPISLLGENQGSENSFRAHPKIIDGLMYAGFTILSLANNHIFDWGRIALSDTIRILSQSNIQYVGAGDDYEDANSLKIIRKNGYTVGFLSYTNLYPQSFFATEKNSGISEYNEQNILNAVQSARQNVDIVVVQFHWGDEYMIQANEIQKKLGRAVIDAGADIVIGHHPHVAQEIEQYKNGWIAYSLGNFIFDQPFSQETMRGIVAYVICNKPHVCVLKPVPVMLNKDFQPTFVGL